MINELVRLPFDSTLMGEDLDTDKFFHVIEGDVLFVLNEQNVEFSGEHKVDQYGFYSPLTDPVSVQLSLYASSEVAEKDFIKKYDTFLEIFKKEKVIKGFMVLNLATMQKLWVSKFDLEYIRYSYPYNEYYKSS